jgi:general L-amino acid transport system permease protein
MWKSDSPRISVRFFLKDTFLSSPINVAMTIAYLALATYVIPKLIAWLVVNASLGGDSRAACDGSGACWTFVKVYFGRFIYGRYPVGERWRVGVVLVLFVLALLPVVLKGQRSRWQDLLVLIAVFPMVAAILLNGGWFGLSAVPSDEWGGVTLNLVLWFGATVGCFPLGIVLALGRRSKLPIVSTIATAYIEFFRGVPLVTVLFAASVMLPIFLPAGTDSSRLTRALVAFILFHAAYMAEIVRGGLQAIPKGQDEAARSLGLKYRHVMALIVLPQALRIVVPAIVNLLIDLLKGTSLVTIIGLVDLLNVAQQGSSDPEWLGLSWEGYIFVAAIFFTLCSGMSIYSRRLERRAAV